MEPSVVAAFRGGGGRRSACWCRRPLSQAGGRALWCIYGRNSAIERGEPPALCFI